MGKGEFIEWIKEKFLKKEASAREQPALKILRKAGDPEELIEHFGRMIGKSREDICQRGKKSIHRAMLMELLYRLCPINQPEIGRLVGGIDYSAVSQARKRLWKRMEKDSKLRREYEKISDRLIQLSRRKI